MGPRDYAAPVRRRTCAVLAVAAAAAVLAVDATAAEAISLRGRTSQGLGAGVRIGPDGLAQRVTIGWTAPCRRAHARFRDGTLFRGPLPVSTTTAFRAAGTYRLDVGQGLRARVLVRVRGRQVNSHRWRGTFSASAIVLRRGRRYDSCRTRTVRWRASIPRLTFDMTSDSGDYIGQGGTYSYRSPQDRVHFRGNRRVVDVSVKEWGLSFAAPRGRRLTPGHYAGAIRYPFNDAKAGLNIDGYGRGCNELTGEFTIHSSSFDRRGRVRAMDVSFVQHCEGGPAALRGRLTFSRG
jgi:hypothetical protein